MKPRRMLLLCSTAVPPRIEDETVGMDEAILWIVGCSVNGRRYDIGLRMTDSSLTPLAGAIRAHFHALKRREEEHRKWREMPFTALPTS